MTMAEEKRPEWMTNISSIVDPDEYLLGRKIDKTFELAQKEKADKAREARIELLAKDQIKLSHDPILDLERRRRQLKKELIHNPVLMKQFRDKLLKSELSRNKADQSSSDMSGFNRKKGKVQVHGEKPEMPAFIQRMKEQLVANEDKERKERSEKRRRERAGDTRYDNDEPTIVKLRSDDLTEAEYKRMKRELDTQYKIPGGDKYDERKPVEDLDIDQFIKSDGHSRSRRGDNVASSTKTRDHRSSDPGRSSEITKPSYKSSRRHESSRKHVGSRRHDDVKSHDRSSGRDYESSKRQDSPRSHEQSSRHRKVLTYGSSSEESH